MPLPARDLWAKIQKEIRGQPEREQLRILQSYLDDWHDSWKGPYWDLKERLRKLVRKLENTESVRSHSQPDTFHVKRQGDAQVGLIGLPNSGKSALVYTLTGAPTIIADYPFATQHPMPGILTCPGGAIQLVDTPAIVPGLPRGEGAGRALLHLIGTMDALGIVVDVSEDPLPQVQTILSELETMHLEPVPRPLGTVLHPKGKGGIKFSGLEISKPDQTSARRILAEAGIAHAEIVIRTHFVEDELVAQTGHRKLLPALILANKNDVEGSERRIEALSRACPAYRLMEVNCFSEDYFAELIDTLLDLLGLIRVGVLEKPAPDAEHTLHLVPRASAIREIAESAGRARDDSLRGARVWGGSVSQPGQTVSVHHLAQEEDLIFLQG